MLSRGTCLFAVELERLLRKLDGVGLSLPLLIVDDAVEPALRFLLRIVTEDGTVGTVLGEPRGGVLAEPAGSLDRADCTRASRRCICAVSVRIWVSELEGGILCARVLGGGLLVVEFLWAGVRNAAEAVATRLPRVEELDAPPTDLGLDAMLLSAEGNRDFLWDVGPFVTLSRDRDS